MRKTIVEVAQSRGSSAKTKAGAWKYLLARLPSPHPGLKKVGTGKTGHTKVTDWDLLYKIIPMCTPGHGMAEGDPRLVSAKAAYRAVTSRQRSERRANRIAAALGYSLHSEQWAWYCDAYEMHREHTRRCTAQLSRDGYGAVTCTTGLAKPGLYNAAYWQALDMVELAAKTDLIDRAFDSIEFDKGNADGEAVHHELYDFSPGAAIVCVRCTEGTKYGVRTVSKTYYLIEQSEETVLCTLTTKPIGRWAKQSAEFGQVISAVRGEAKISPPAAQPVPGYKLLRVNEDGTLESVWDGSAWDLGKRRTEAARADHSGGLYYYRDLSQCLEAAQTNSVFHPDMEHHRLAVLRIEAQGRHIGYFGGKYAATHITPLEVIAMTV